MLRVVVVAALCGLSAPVSAQDQLTAAPSPAEAAYAGLKTLVGTWTAPLAPGKALRVSFKLIANDSTLVETYTTPNGRETITVFHLDGARLLATHYCAQGNQPRLALSRATATQWVFDFVDATNLTGPGASHLQHLELALADAKHFTMTESYREAGQDEAETHRFTRVAK